MPRRGAWGLGALGPLLALLPLLVCIAARAAGAPAQRPSWPASSSPPIAPIAPIASVSGPARLAGFEEPTPADGASAAAPASATSSSAAVGEPASPSVSVSPTLPSISPSVLQKIGGRRGPEDAGKPDAARSRSVLRMLLGLGLTVVLAILAAQPRVRRLEARFGLTLAVASGLPFLLLGIVFQHPAIDVLDERVLRELAPFVEFGLGWVGFLIGLEFDVRRLDDLPSGTGGAIALEVAVPFLLVSVLATATITGLRVAGHEGGWTDPLSLRNGLVVGACAALSAATAPLALARGAGKAAARVIDRMAQLDDVAALIVLLVVSAFFRPLKSVDWQIPGIGWLFVGIGFGCVLGMLSYALMRAARNEREELAFTLGAVCFSAGVSGRLGFSPLVVCGVAGALLANLPRRPGTHIAATLRTVERPVYLLFMLFAGATVPLSSWQAWVLLPVYVVTRVLGKIVGVRLSQRFGPSVLRDAKGMSLALMPQSQLGVATMIATTNLYLASKDNALGWIFLAVVVGGYVNDVGTQVVAQYIGRVSSASIDEAARTISIHPVGGYLPDGEAGDGSTGSVGRLSVPKAPPVPRIEPPGQR